MLALFIILYLLLTVAIGLYASRKVVVAEDYALAGRSLPFYLSISSFFATWFGAETILGASSQFAEFGFRGIIEDPLGASLCLILTGLFFVKLLYPKGYISIGDYFKERYGRGIEFFSSLLQAISYFTYTSAQFVALGLVLETVTPFSFHTCLLVGSLLVVCYTFGGGMWAIAITDFFQTLVIIGGLAILAVFLWLQLPEKVSITQVIPPISGIVPESSFEGWSCFFTSWIILGFGSIPSQDIFQRIMSAKSLKTAKYAALGSGILYLTVALLPLIIVCLSQFIFSNNIKTDFQQLIPKMVLEHMPLPIQILFFGALLSAILSTASASLLAQATVIGENLVKPMFSNFSEKKFLLLLRLMVLFSAMISIVICLDFKNIFHLSSYSSSFILVTLFAPLTLGLIIKKAEALAAWISIILGLSIFILGKYLEMELMAVFWGFMASVLGFFIGHYTSLITNR